jgi:ketosteroid isomerase-like protein
VTDDRTPETIANSILMRLDGGARRRDLTGVLDLFVDDAALFGSDAGEFAVGRADVRRFLAGLFAEPVTYGWTWDHPVAGRHGDVVWFVADGQAILEGEGAPPPVPYRLSGVLLHVNGGWRFTLFNGTQPVPE